MEKEELSEKIHNELINRFHVKMRAYNITADSFKYEFFKDRKINMYQVNYTDDEKGFHVEWETVKIVEYNFRNFDGEGGISMDGA